MLGYYLVEAQSLLGRASTHIEHLVLAQDYIPRDILCELRARQHGGGYDNFNLLMLSCHGSRR